MTEYKIIVRGLRAYEVESFSPGMILCCARRF
jgi:hypothetical protein